MDKKRKLQIKRDESLAEIDDELDGALESLEKANARIGDLLATIEDGGQEALSHGVGATEAVAGDGDGAVSEAAPEPDGAQDRPEPA